MASAGDRLQIVIGAKDELSAKLRETKKEIRDLGRAANDMQRRYENGEQGVQGEIEQTRQHLDRLRLKHQDLERQQKENNAEYKRLMTSGKVAAMNLTRSFDAVQRHLGITDGKANWLRRSLERLDNGAYAFRTKWSIALAAVQARMTRLRESAAFQALVSMGRTGFMIAGAALAGGAAMGLTTKATLENQLLSLEQLLGSKKKAVETQNWIVEQAAKTPFSLTDLSGATQKLLGFGFELDDVKEKLLVIGDVAAGTGTGAEGIDAITRAMGQMQAKQKITGEEMMQLTEAGIPAWKILAKEMGMSTKELMEMASSQGGGALLFDQGGLDKLFGGLDKQYGGLMKKQARTLGGRWSTFTDTLRTELSKLFDGKSGKGIKMLLKWAAEEMPKAFKAMKPYIRDFSKMIERNWPQIQSVLKGIGNAYRFVAGLIKGVIIVAGKLFKVLAGIIRWAVDDAAPAIGRFFTGIGEWFSNLWQSIKDIGGKIGDWFTGVFDGIANAFDTWSDAIRNVINTVIGWINKIPGVNIDLITDPGDLAPGRWMGGPVLAGHPYTVGEIGPELFVPNVGSPRMVGTNGPEVRDFHTSGTIIPTQMVGAYVAATTAENARTATNAPSGVQIGELHVHDRFDAQRELQALLARERRIAAERS